MAVCGWGYLLIVLAPWFEAGLGQHLPTTYLLAYAHGKLQPPTTTPVGLVLPTSGSGANNSTIAFGNDGTLVSAADATGSVRVWDAATGQALPYPLITATGPDAGLVLRTGHALFALLFGFIGGVTAKSFYLTRSPREEEGRRG